MDYGTFDVLFEGEKSGELEVREDGLRAEFICRAEVQSSEVLRLAAVVHGRYEIIGVMMPEKSGGLKLKKSFTHYEIKTKSLDAAESYALIHSGDIYVPQEEREEKGEEETPGGGFAAAEDIPEGMPAKWQTCKNPGELFSDMQLKGALAGITDALRREEGEDTFVAIPVKEDRPFPDLPVFYYGDEEKIDGREYLVFRVCGGELRI